jgi:molecular chaperone DnaJ
MVEDYYALLGVDRRASPEDIKRAYRRLTLLNHPDRNPDDPSAPERYRRINQAYNTLSDASARARYDAGMRLPGGLDLTRGFDGQSAKDLLTNVFGDVFRTRRRDRRKGRDLRYTLTLDLEEAVLGSTHAIEFEAPGACTVCSGTGVRPGGRPPDTCPLCAGRGEVKGEGLFARWSKCGRCEGTGLLQLDACEACRGVGRRRQRRSFQVRIPPGTESGAQKVLEGEGEPGRYGGESGDLRVTVNVRRHPWLSRHGEEIRCEAPISLTEASFGARVPVPTVDGVVVVDIPPGVRSGTRLRLRGKGVPRSKGASGRGDQFVTVVIETPTVGADPALDDVLRRLERLSRTPGVLPRRAAQRGAFASNDGQEPEH